MGERPIMSLTRRKREHGLSIVRLQPGQQREYRIASSRLMGVWTHFLDEARTYPCTAGAGPCRWDHTQTSLRWQGWLQVCPPGTPASQFLGITWAAVRDCPRLLVNGNATLRSCALVASRGAASIRSRQFMILGFPDPNARLPIEEQLRAWYFDMLGPEITWPRPTNPAWIARPTELNDIVWCDNPFVDATAS